MAIGHRELAGVMNRVVSKLQTLLLPLRETEGTVVGPLPQEVCAALALMEWMTAELTLLLTEHAEELRMHRRGWPNVTAWRGFEMAISSLPVAEGALKQGVLRLLEVAAQMRAVAPGAGAEGKAKQSVLLPHEAQRAIYKERVLTYYRDYMEGRGLPHKVEMRRWAALFQALNDRVCHLDYFPGPDWDHFIYDYCGIRYNTSDKPRGRYRQVADVWTACTDPKSQMSARDRQQFWDFRQDALEVMREEPLLQDVFAGVPRPLK